MRFTDKSNKEEQEMRTLNPKSSATPSEPSKPRPAADLTTSSEQQTSSLAETPVSFGVVLEADKIEDQNATERQQPQKTGASTRLNNATGDTETSLELSLRLGTNIVWKERHFEIWNRNCYDYTVDLIAKGILNQHPFSRDEVNSETSIQKVTPSRSTSCNKFVRVK